MAYMDEDDHDDVRGTPTDRIAEHLHPQGNPLWRGLFLRWTDEHGVRPDVERAETLLEVLAGATSPRELVVRLETVEQAPWDDTGVFVETAESLPEPGLLAMVRAHREDSTDLADALAGDDRLQQAWEQVLALRANSYLAEIRKIFLAALDTWKQEDTERRRARARKAVPDLLGLMRVSVRAAGVAWEFTSQTGDVLTALEALGGLEVDRGKLIRLARKASGESTGSATHTLARAFGMAVRLSATPGADLYQLEWKVTEQNLLEPNRRVLDQLGQEGAVCYYAQLDDAVLLSLGDQDTAPFLRLLQGAAVSAGGVSAGSSLGEVENKGGVLRVAAVHRGYKRKFIKAVRAAGWRRDIRFSG
ncbi:hypothetical protein [Umezawaea sp. Da 62-37]|uniref:hypothetical protein n=1 Tax=Umezawaea sp. Da 62-37 TaxID=3075927 RepID=UPI0028F6EA94|nr:hypothetical protein [Umezawaea sp. Da 62-37]WNV87971.1 hypothetical protein RM788_06695 [Umezawaea sp. Da 62-37]